MTKYSLIVGMGIGQLYRNVLTNLGHEIVTVDIDSTKDVDFHSLQAALDKYQIFDTVHICTPNFTHYDIAEQVAPHACIVFVEKPGVETSEDWKQLIEANPWTRFMMVKNNMWRTNIEELKQCAAVSVQVNIDWINLDRVPNPGTWFTTKSLSYGGVSRDLMPHLLSIFMALDSEYSKYRETIVFSEQQWKLEDLTQTDYGIVKHDGTYNVDDYCQLQFRSLDKTWNLRAQWRNTSVDSKQIEFIMTDGSSKIFELGLCPEVAYQNMIAESIVNMNNDSFWLSQNIQDLWIHKKVETL